MKVVAALVDEPFRLSIAQIARLTDAQIYGLYLCPRDEDGRPDWSQYRGAKVASAVPMPSAEELRIPPEAFTVSRVSPGGQMITPPVGYVLTWWWVWRQRQEQDGWSDAELMAKWRECVERGW